MARDHMLGYWPATQEDWSGLEADRYAYGWGEARMGEGPREVAPRRWIGLTCMTKADQDARQHDVQAGRLGLPVFYVEKPGVLVLTPEGPGALWYKEQVRGHEHARHAPVPAAMTQADMISGMQAKDLSEALAVLRKRCPQPMLDGPGDPSVIAHDPDWNDG